MTAQYALAFLASLSLIAFAEPIVNKLAYWYKARARRKDQHRRKRQGDKPRMPRREAERPRQGNKTRLGSLYLWE